MLTCTKIVATLGPASSDPVMLEQMIEAGVNTVRLNFSHGTARDHIERARTVRAIADKLGVAVAVLADLQGPKIRIGKIEHDRIELIAGDAFILDAACELGNRQRVGLDYKELPNDVEPGTILLLDDGKIRLQVDQVLGTEVWTHVLVGGPLSSSKGINRLGGGLTAPALTEKDRRDIETCAELEADYVAISFPRSAADMDLARALLAKAGSNASLIAKIERCEAVGNLAEILDASDGIMVARGDLAVETGDAAVPALQKRMIRLARQRHKLAITATQMMESMIDSPVPTRAEVSDCANAVLDGTDAVMLSAESATGRYPLEAVKAMVRICREAEQSGESHIESEFRDVGHFARGDQVIAMSTIYAAQHLHLKSIVSLTRSGASPLWLSRYVNNVPIHAVTADRRVYRRLALYRHVSPLLIDEGDDHRERLISRVKAGLIASGDLCDDDWIAVMHDMQQGNGVCCLRIEQGRISHSL